MSTSLNIDFKNIASRCGGQREAFEELACQLARRQDGVAATFIRLNGAGGDGGVECYWTQPDGTRAGIQAKYLSEVDALLTQAGESLDTALGLHPTLTTFIVVFPFDLTGPTNRRGKSGTEKWNEWKKAREDAATATGRSLTIEQWPAFEIRRRLIEVDQSGGLRAYFFDATILTESWFQDHLNTAKRVAGPRYTPRLNVETPLRSWLSGLGRTTVWEAEVREQLNKLRTTTDRFEHALHQKGDSPLAPSWPAELAAQGGELSSTIKQIFDSATQLTASSSADTLAGFTKFMGEARDQAAVLNAILANDFDTKHGQGKSNSKGFRQYMAEYFVSFPASNLDTIRAVEHQLEEAIEYFDSARCRPAFSRSFLVTGNAGAGKTHSMCDVAEYRLTAHLLTCVCFGHQFSGEASPFTRLAEVLGLSPALGRDGVLDALNAAGEATRKPLLLMIDAINETRPEPRVWKEHLPLLEAAIEKRPFLRLAVTCRTSYVTLCVQDPASYLVAEHTGFKGMERFACQSFFAFYELEAPISPILQPEVGNPLYLRLLCETLKGLGLKAVPAGWTGLAPVIGAFVGFKEKQFADFSGTLLSAAVVAGSLKAIAKEIADTGGLPVRISRATTLVNAVRPIASSFGVVEWLIRSDLLIEDMPTGAGIFDQEGTVRPAFERLGDFLVADAFLDLLNGSVTANAFSSEGALFKLFETPETVETNSGTVGALSILIAERESGRELPDLLEERQDILRATLRVSLGALPWRSPKSITGDTSVMVERGFGSVETVQDALDAVMGISWHPSAVDALWFHDFLGTRKPADRDSVWCGYLTEQFEKNGPALQLVRAVKELSGSKIDKEIALRWCVMLLWFTAAADRRMKDEATRAATRLLETNFEIAEEVADHFTFAPDDEVRHRALLSIYGAALLNRDSRVGIIARDLLITYDEHTDRFEDAILRDLIRCIGDLARHRGVLPAGIDPETPGKVRPANWTCEQPSEEELAFWKSLPRLYKSCLDDDFSHYTLNCLRGWDENPGRENLGRWILSNVAKTRGYAGSNCTDYDRVMISTHGPGRSRPKWAERIGKKYQWLAMNELASRLHDNVEPKKDSWSQTPDYLPLILMEERKLDPTVLTRKAESDRKATKSWWISDQCDLAKHASKADEEWALKNDDLPRLEKLLQPLEHDDSKWQLLLGFPEWDAGNSENKWDTPFRDVWLHVCSYVVPTSWASRAFKSINGRNFFGRWMPESATYSNSFAGEYPWSIAFRDEPDWSYIHESLKVPGGPLPAWEDISVGWEYDATLPETYHIHVPSRRFFAANDLHWNGADGYTNTSGKMVFADPSIREAGPSGLVADGAELRKRLKDCGLSMIWTLLGEKRIVGGKNEDIQRPHQTFSQCAILLNDGSIKFGKFSSFQEYDQSKGPMKASS